MKKKNKVNLKKVVKAKCGQDMGAGSSGMGAGKIAEGTYDKTSLILSLNISFLINAIIENLVR